MTAVTIFEPAKDDAEDLPGTPLRWGICLALVAALHVSIFLAALYWMPAPALPPSPPVSAVMMELAPLPLVPPAPPNEMPPGPKQSFAQPPPQPEIPQHHLMAPPSPAPQIAIPLPPPKPIEQHREHHPPRRRAPDKAQPAPASTAPPQLQAPPALSAAAPSPGASAAPSATAVPSWQALLLARLEQFKRYPYAAQLYHQEGIVYLHFTMDRQGHVLSADISTSSGFDSLDQETLALIRRAEPLPPPPPAIPGDPVELTVPLQFHLK